MMGSRPCCSRRACQLKLVDCEISRSAIFTFQPAAAYSRATRRARVLLPTPPFCDTIPRKSAIVEKDSTKTRKKANTVRDGKLQPDHSHREGFRPLMPSLTTSLTLLRHLASRFIPTMRDCVRRSGYVVYRGGGQSTAREVGACPE